MAGVSELVADPSWLPDGYDPARDVVRFARVDREALKREAFLDGRMAASVQERAEAPFAEVAATVERSSPPPPPAFLFHSSFCCSTLLARALDAPGRTLALKEPNVLLDLANALRVQERFRRDVAQFDRAVGVVFSLLARPHAEGERVLVKPTNTASTLLAFALKRGARCLLLYGGLRDFLISILKKGEEGRSFVRGQYNIFALDGGGLSAIPARQAMTFTDLQVATIVWRHQVEQFHRALASGDGRLVSLDFRILLAEPARTLKGAARHLELGIPDASLDAVAKGEIFARDAKFSDRAYDTSARTRDEAALEERWAAELDLMETWAKGLHLGVDARLPLPRVLIS
jgi:hypothetical protein